MPRKQKKFHLLYKTTNILNNNYYVGIHSTDNPFDGYKGSGMKLCRSVKKYGAENHHVEFLDIFKNREDLINAEKVTVTREFLNDPLCMNINVGGVCKPLNVGITEETRRKLSVANRGRVISPEWREKISKANKGKKMSEEAKRKTKEANAGRVQSDEERKMRSDAVKDKGAYNSRPVICYGIEYIDSHKAASALNLTPKQVKNYSTSKYNMDFQYKDSPKEFIEKIPHGSVPIMIHGVEYINKSVAAKALGMTVKMIHGRCRSEKYPEYYFKD